MKQLGKLLIEESMLTQDQLEQALKAQSGGGGKLGDCLVKLGFLSEHALYYFLAMQRDVEFVELSEAAFSPEIIQSVPKDVANRYQVVPWKKKDTGLVLVSSDPSDPKLFNLREDMLLD